MKLLFLVACMVFLVVVPNCSAKAPKTPKVKAAVSAAEEWLEGIDSGAYRESWSSTGTIFRNSLSASKWEDALDKTRKPLGDNVLRSLKSAKTKTSLPGVPDGEYVVMTFRAQFEKKKKSVETVTAALESGEWRIVG